MKRFFRALGNDPVSLILLLLCIIAVVGYYVKELNFTPFLAIIALNIIFDVNEKSKFIERLKKLDIDLSFLGTNDPTRELLFFEKVVLGFILLGGLVILGFVTYYLVF